MIDVDTLRCENAGRNGLSVTQWRTQEAAAALGLLAGSDDVPRLPSVDTTVSLLDIEDRRYALRNGHLVDPRRRIVYEAEVVPSLGSHRIAILPLERTRHVDGVVACLSQSDNYGHWHLLALPLIKYYRNVLGGDPDYYYVGSKVRPWQIESLEMLGVTRARIVKEGVTANRLLVAIADRKGGYDRDFLLYADTHLHPSKQPVRGGRRLFVSRALASQRRLVNEAECADALRHAFDVELVATEGMSLDDEIALFREAELVVGAHGAGLTNCVFAPSGSHLVDLISTTFWDSQIAQIAAAKRMRYSLIRGRPSGIRFGVPASQHDFEIEVERLLRVVGAAVEGSSN